MSVVAIVAGGPIERVPELSKFNNEITTWIGADRGAVTLLDEGISPDLAIGDFDSITEQQLALVRQKSSEFDQYPVEKDETDLELAILKALDWAPTKIYFFGVTGGRLDHGMVSIQLLYRLLKKSVVGVIIDISNSLELYYPGKYEINQENCYSNISFLPFSQQVTGITLQGFYYKLVNTDISWGSTRCISNKLISEKGTFSFTGGILLVIKSRDVLI